MALQAEEYSFTLVTKALGKSRSVEEAKKAALAKAKELKGVLAVEMTDHIGYRQETDQYEFGATLVMSEPPAVGI